MRSKIEDVFGNTMSVKDKKALATLIYYPKSEDGTGEADGVEYG